LTSATIDTATFRSLQDTAGAEFVTELVGTYLEEAPQMISDLKSALTAGEADRFRRAAHSLKSNSNTFGAHALGAMAKELELGGLAQARGAKPDALAALEAEFARVAAALRELAGA
jgi:HPt (histidine-containing phosphotransfer) domain-containing protein